MTRIGWLATAVGLWGLVACTVPAVSADPQSDLAENEAQAAAEFWLWLVDSGDYAMSWKTSAVLFQEAIEKGDWDKTLKRVREPLGAVTSRKLKSKRYTHQLPGAPDGEYVVVQYDTVFKNKASATETVTPMRQADGTWRISGYYIQ